MNRRAARAGGSLPASSRKLRFRRADTVVSYWLARVLVFENYLAHTRISGDPLLASILHFCSVPRTLPELAAEYPEVSANELRQGVRNLLRYALLELYPPSQSKYAGSFEAWESWRPSAAYFHFSTRDMQYPKTKVDDFTGLRRIAKEHRLPPMQKKYPRAGKIFLPAPRMKGEFASVCKQRRTWREFSPAPVDLQCLSG